MRAGACALQQTLTSEAASVLKHSLSLARRRGHAQVTPLHVAAILLSSRLSLFRTACLKSQPHQASHPLHCRALELCFNVALNRLPTTPGPLLHGQPSLSNALIAALKRAQAHQRRGCIEQQQHQQQQQQQPLLAIKVELEQLILSILDDPSVSRVMREAGFSSTAVKSNLEDCSASTVFQCYNTCGGVYSTPSSPPTESHHREVINPGSFWQTHLLTFSSVQSPFLFSPQKKILNSNQTTGSVSSKEDIQLVFEVLLRKKRKNTVIVGDSASITEGLALEIMSKVEKGDVPEDLKSSRLIKFMFSSVPLRFMKRKEVEQNLSDLKRKVDSLASDGGVIIYTGDLKWTVDSNVGEREGGGIYRREATAGYDPIDHLVAEIGKLLSEYSSSNAKVWLMATANYQTYMRCQMKQPSLELQWSLQAVSVPSAGLGLSLNAASVHDSRTVFPLSQSPILPKKSVSVKEEQDVLTCCAECTSNYLKEAGSFKSSHNRSSPLFAKEMNKVSNQLPYWLQPSESESHSKDDLVELRRKWNRLCNTLHQDRHTHSSVNPLSVAAVKNDSYASSYSQGNNQKSIFSDLSFVDSSYKPKCITNSLPRFRRQNSCHIEFSFSNIGSQKHQVAEPNLDSLKINDNKEAKISLALGSSPSSSDTVDLAERSTGKTTQNENICRLIEDNVPWLSKIVPAIVETIVDPKEINKDTWFLIEGSDTIGKRRLARSIAESVFGSSDLLFCFNMKERNHKTSSCSDEFLRRAIRDHANLVILVENIDSADAHFANYLADGFESGNLGGEKSGKAIIILTRGNEKENQTKVIQMKLQVSDQRETTTFDHKRKANWNDMSSASKNSRITGRGSPSSVAVEDGSFEKEFKRQLSSNTLDLNLRAEEDDETNADEEEQEEVSPISINGSKSPAEGLIEKIIKNRFAIDQDSGRDGLMRETFMTMIRGSFVEVMGSQSMGYFTVDQAVVEEVFYGSGSFLNSLFERWMKDVFQTSLQTVRVGGKEGMTLRLTLGENSSTDLRDGFMGSNLPCRIQVSGLMYCEGLCLESFPRC